MRRLSNKTYPEPKYQKPKNWRQEYAIKFNTYKHNVAYWDELTEELKLQAHHRFSSVNLSDHVYHLGGKPGQRRIIARRPLEFGDRGA